MAIPEVTAKALNNPSSVAVPSNTYVSDPDLRERKMKAAKGIESIRLT